MSNSTNRIASNALSYIIGLSISMTIVLVLLQWFNVPVGSLIDWLIGIAMFVWLIMVVTLPWNVYFEAVEVITESKNSEKQNIQFDKNKLVFVKKLANAMIFIAIFLHLASAAGFYVLSYYEITKLGYFGAIASLLLTLLRPLARAYEYISDYLFRLREEIHYPRPDVKALEYRVESLEYRFNTIEELTIEDKIYQLSEQLEDLIEKNQKEHEKLSKETHHAVAQLTEDGKFIDHLLEIIRFIKRV
ncbi:MAG: hypothetical protein EAZ55_00960 [Cytophagales bacterium]|nr:MAG: hypothetical protein EAZ55_00960 [Cytophagales bacterium]